MLLPIPTHLISILVPLGDKNNENHIDGVIQCACGCELFHMRIFADVENGYPQVREYGDGFSLIVKAICNNCGKEHLVFDSSEHGWDGFVCHEGIAVPSEELKSWNCIKCGSDVHQIEVSISSQGKQDFIDETGIADGNTEFNEDDWVNAFDWITISLKCYGCKHNDKKWIDYETM